MTFDLVVQSSECAQNSTKWGVGLIGKYFELINGCAFKPSDWKARGLPIVRIQNLNDNLAPFNYTDRNIDKKYRLEPGDLVFAWSGTTGTSFGARIWKGPAGVLNQHIFRVVPNTDFLDIIFSFFILKQIQVLIEAKAHGFKSSFLHVKKADLVKIPFPIPPLAEQQAIATALSDMDALIAAQEKLIAKKRDIKTATMQQLLTGYKRLPGFNQPWHEKCFGELAQLDPENLGVGTPREYRFKYISLESVDTGRLVSHAEVAFGSAPSRARRVMRHGDVLMSTVRPLLRSHLFFQSNQRDWVASTGFCVLRCRPEVSSPEFLFQSVFSNHVERQVEAMLGGSNYPSLNGQDIQKLRIPVPPLAEQRAIAEVLSDMDAEITALETRPELRFECACRCASRAWSVRH